MQVREELKKKRKRNLSIPGRGTRLNSFSKASRPGLDPAVHWEQGYSFSGAKNLGSEVA